MEKHIGFICRTEGISSRTVPVGFKAAVEALFKWDARHMAKGCFTELVETEGGPL